MPGWNRLACRETGATSRSLWEVLLDGRRWSLWQPGIEWMVLEGELEAGNFLTVKPKGWLQTAFVLTEVVTERAIAYETRVGPLVTFGYRYDIAGDGAARTIGVALKITGVATPWAVRFAGSRAAAHLETSLERWARIALER